MTLSKEKLIELIAAELLRQAEHNLDWAERDPHGDANTLGYDGIFKLDALADEIIAADTRQQAL